MRIEDTDKKRSTQEAIDAILGGLNWLGLDYDEDPTYQSQRADRHAEIAHALLESGNAYKCFATPDELEAMRAEQRDKKLPLRYDGRWRDRDATDAPDGTSYTVRLKTPLEGKATIQDQVQGEVSVSNEELDDYIILRADGSPTYMLAAVVDDYDMGVTHVIRGDDHLNNAFRQLPIYDAMGWQRPTYAHIPLIHGSDGAKLSKRHGAVGVEAYRDELGILPEAMFNYLLRLGWASGDREEFTRDEAITLFNVGGIGKGPSRFDLKKLEHLNGHYIRTSDDTKLAQLTANIMGNIMGNDAHLDILTQAMPVLKTRAKNLNDLADGAGFLFASIPLEMTEKAKNSLTDEGKERLKLISERYRAEKDWTIEALEATTKAMAEELDVGFGKLAQPLRAALTGTMNSPGIYDVLVLLGREEALARIDAQVASPSGE